jgi:hypothetical protein
MWWSWPKWDVHGGVEASRCAASIENEYNNVLSFLIHGLQDLADDDYKQARAAFSMRDEIYAALRSETSYHLHTTWTELLNLLAGIDPDG